jgi:3-hydroxyacyl-[acyl-carrier protein] dehydratase/trans-2-decenoyl-[acyl-carrier protein] isomerase
VGAAEDESLGVGITLGDDVGNSEWQQRRLFLARTNFSGQIRPYNKLVRYEIDIRRYAALADTGAAIAVGTGTVIVDEEPIYVVKDAKVGIFTGIRYPDYPLPSANSRGGIMVRE